MATTPMSPKDFTRQLSSRLNQLQHQSFPTQSIVKHINPSIVVDSPGHHDELEHVSRSSAVTNGNKLFGLGCCIPSISNRVAQNPIEEISHRPIPAYKETNDGRKDSFECGRKDSHDSGIYNPTITLEKVPEDEPARQRRPGVCMSHQSSNVSEICQQFERIVDEHKVKQDRLNRKSSTEEPQYSSIRKSSSTSVP